MLPTEVVTKSPESGIPQNFSDGLRKRQQATGYRGESTLVGVKMKDNHVAKPQRLFFAFGVMFVAVLVPVLVLTVLLYINSLNEESTTITRSYKSGGPVRAGRGVSVINNQVVEGLGLQTVSETSIPSTSTTDPVAVFADSLDSYSLTSAVHSDSEVQVHIKSWNPGWSNTFEQLLTSTSAMATFFASVLLSPTQFVHVYSVDVGTAEDLYVDYFTYSSQAGLTQTTQALATGLPQGTVKLTATKVQSSSSTGVVIAYTSPDTTTCQYVIYIVPNLGTPFSRSPIEGTMQCYSPNLQGLSSITLSSGLTVVAGYTYVAAISVDLTDGSVSETSIHRIPSLDGSTTRGAFHLIEYGDKLVLAAALQRNVGLWVTTLSSTSGIGSIVLGEDLERAVPVAIVGGYAITGTSSNGGPGVYVVFREQDKLVYFVVRLEVKVQASSLSIMTSDVLKGTPLFNGLPVAVSALKSGSGDVVPLLVFGSSSSGIAVVQWKGGFTVLGVATTATNAADQDCTVALQGEVKLHNGDYKPGMVYYMAPDGSLTSNNLLSSLDFSIATSIDKDQVQVNTPKYRYL